MKKTLSTPSASLQLVIPVVIAIVVFELLLLTGQVTLALLGHAWLLFHCLTLLLYTTDPPLSLRSITLVPVFRLTTLGRPELFEGSLNWLVVSYFLLFVTMLVFVRSPQYRPNLWRRVSAKTIARLLGLAVSAYVLSGILFSIDPPTSVRTTMGAEQVFVLFALFVLFVPLVEELLFRGLIQGQLETEYGAGVSVIVSGVLYAAMHSLRGRLLVMLLYLGFGLVFAVGYRLGGGLIPAVVLHSLANFLYYFGDSLQFPLFG
ncbi:CPBP family intramembrane glutamic endopeptidase [Salinigranum salinum]|uniref:CPBP family intramembrane glutamic endopeptidase n=1 Tax=Salinigranum salinum TaxID=1364937 RepID=UPI001864AB7F|nr:CPBP family intramembrane glutamic endopeptidase [Salinigranum salinum]